MFTVPTVTGCGNYPEFMQSHTFFQFYKQTDTFSHWTKITTATEIKNVDKEGRFVDNGTFQTINIIPCRLPYALGQ